MAIADNPYAETLISSVKIYNLDRGSGLKYLRLDCPWCAENTGKADHKGHLHFYLDNSISRCMRCDAWGNVGYLFRALGLVLPNTGSGYGQYYRALRETVDARLAQMHGTTAKAHSALIAPEIDLPEDGFPIASLNPRFTPHARVLHRLEEWRISLTTARKLKWHWSAGFDAFVFPVFDEGGEMERLVYWSTRSFDGNFRTSAPTDFAPYGILGHFNHPLRKTAKEVYIVEGPRDAAALLQEGFFAVYLFGHKPNPAQIARLEKLSQRKVLLLDADVTELASSLADRLGWTVLYLPKGDPGDYAGRIRATLAEAWENSRSSLDRRLSHIRQKLFTPQIHHRH